MPRKPKPAPEPKQDTGRDYKPTSNVRYEQHLRSRNEQPNPHKPR